MIKVRSYIDKSKIHGIGLFASEFIPKGTIIWEFSLTVDKVITKEEFDEIEKSTDYKVFKDLRNHISRVSEQLFMMYGDNAKFINHSLDSNVLEVSIFTTVAKRDIEMDEELTENYLETNFYEDSEFLQKK